MGAQQFSMMAIKPSCRKADLPKTRDNNMITRKLVQTEINFALGKNGAYLPSSLGSRLIGVCRQAFRQAGSEMKIFAV